MFGPTVTAQHSAPRLLIAQAAVPRYSSASELGRSDREPCRIMPRGGWVYVPAILSAGALYCSSRVIAMLPSWCFIRCPAIVVTETQAVPLICLNVAGAWFGARGQRQDAPPAATGAARGRLGLLVTEHQEACVCLPGEGVVWADVPTCLC